MHTKAFLKKFIEKIKKVQLAETGAMLAYNFLFSLFPFIIVLLNLISFIAAGYEQNVLELINVLPADAASIIKPFVSDLINSRSTGILSISLIIALWPSSNGMQKIMNEVNKAFDGSNYKRFFFQKFLAIGLALSFVIAIFVLIFTGPVTASLKNILESLLGEVVVLNLLYEAMIFIIPKVFIFLILFLIYKFSLIREEVPSRYPLIGAFFTSVLLSLATFAFTVYVDNFASYNSTYGSLGGIIILLTWLFLIGIIIIIGAYFAATIKDFDENAKIQSAEHSLEP